MDSALNTMSGMSKHHLRDSRRRLLCAAAALPFASWSGAARAERQAAAREQLHRLEADFNGRLGVLAIDAGSGQHLGHRADDAKPRTEVMAAAARIVAGWAG